MSLTLNMVGGGGGLKATDALLRVQAPAGSTVTITKGTIIKTDIGHEKADDQNWYGYYFIIHQSQFDSVNPWTVTATLDENTDSDTIIIDSAKELDIELTYRVPSAYQEVSYIKSSGSQYIDTNFIPTSTRWGFEIDFMTESAMNNSSYGCIIGKRTSSGYNEYQLSTYTSGTTGGLLRMKSTSYSAYLTSSIRQQCSLHNLLYTCPNGETLSVTDESLTSEKLFIFVLNSGGSATQGSTTALYSLKLYNEDDELVADYIPCYRKIDSLAGLWDRINKEFKTNDGSGTFTVGADV